MRVPGAFLRGSDHDLVMRWVFFSVSVVNCDSLNLDARKAPSSSWTSMPSLVSRLQFTVKCSLLTFSALRAVSLLLCDSHEKMRRWHSLQPQLQASLVMDAPWVTFILSS